MVCAGPIIFFGRLAWPYAVLADTDQRGVAARLFFVNNSQPFRRAHRASKATPG